MLEAGGGPGVREREMEGQEKRRRRRRTEERINTDGFSRLSLFRLAIRTERREGDADNDVRRDVDDDDDDDDDECMFKMVYILKLRCLGKM